MVALLQFDAQLMVADGDTEWHIAAGDLIRSTGALPTYDPWSFTAGDSIWYNISWLWDAVFSALYEYAGWHGVIAGNAIIYAALFAGLFFMCVLRSGHGIASFIVLFSLLSVINPIARPMTLGLVLILIVYMLLELVSRGWLSRRWWWAIPPLVLAWANIHGSFIIAFLLMGIYGLTMWTEKNYRDFYYLFAVGCVSLLAGLINPYGAEIYYLVWAYSSSPMNEAITEWHPLALKPGQLISAFFVTLFFGIIIICQPRMSVAEKWSVFVLLLLTLTSQRTLPTFAVIAAPIVASAIASLKWAQGNEANQVPAWVERLCVSCNNVLRSSRTLKAMCAIVLLCAIMLPMPWVGNVKGHSVKSSILDLSEEVAFIEEHYPGTKFYTDYNLGGTLIFQFRGDFPVFIDGRSNSLYEEDLIEDYLAFVNQSKSWPDRFEKRGIEGMMVHSKSSAVRYMWQRKGWNCVFSNDVVYIYVRADKALKKHENACLTEEDISL